MLTEWIRSVRESVRPTKKGQPPATQVNKDVVSAWRYICQHHDQAWTLASMAQKAHLARSQFSEGIIALTGASPFEHLIANVWQLPVMICWPPMTTLLMSQFGMGLIRPTILADNFANTPSKAQANFDRVVVMSRRGLVTMINSGTPTL